MQEEYYFNKLYPAQDKILEIIASCHTDFYLTGGTALSRFYLEHRFSDDLDFFTNNAADFNSQVELILPLLKANNLNFDILKKANDFIRIDCSNSEITIKIDFVNDVPYHSGEIQSFNLFPRVDGWWNILSNKISCVDRREPKDVADILFICRKYSFDWETVFSEGQKKTTYLDPLDVSITLSEFPAQFLARINWISNIDSQKAYTDLQRIAKDILLKGKNSLS